MRRIARTLTPESNRFAGTVRRAARAAAIAATVLSAVGGCGAAAAQIEPAKPASEAPAAARAPKPPQPVIVSARPAPAPPWLEPAKKTQNMFAAGFGNTETVAWGARAALVKSDAGVFATTVERRVVGPLRLPYGAVWAGLVRGDAVLAATSGGALFRADSIAAAAKGTFVPLAQAPDATTWDASGDLVAAGAPRGAVFISTDGGRHFRRRITGAGDIAKVSARADGVVVARVHGPGGFPITYVARRGRRFRRARAQPERLERLGSWIWEHGARKNGDDCGAVLSADGRHWVEPGRDQNPWYGPSWSDMLQTWEQVQAPPRAKHVTATSPPPPAFSRARAIAGRFDCPAERDGVIGEFLAPSREHWGAIRGTNRPVPKPTRHRLLILDDDACVPGLAGGDCVAGAPLFHPLHLVAGDVVAHRVTFLALPAGCSRRSDAAGPSGRTAARPEPGNRPQARPARFSVASPACGWKMSAG